MWRSSGIPLEKGKGCVGLGYILGTRLDQTLFDYFKGGEHKPRLEVEGVYVERVVPAAEYCGRHLSGSHCRQEWCWKDGSLVPGKCWCQVLLVLPSARECSGVSPQGPHISFRGN